MAEKTEPASEKKLRDARRKGEVPRSREVTSAAVFIVSLGVLAWWWPGLLGRQLHLLGSTLESAPHLSLRPGVVISAAERVLLLSLLPVLTAACLAALAAGLAQVRPLFSLHPVKPRLDRMNPLQNARRVLGPAALFELAKTVLKVGGMALAAGWALWERVPLVLATAGGPPEVVLSAVGACLAAVAIRVSLVVIALAALDLCYQRYSFSKRMRMSKKEVEQEQKESEGDPQQKAERRRVHREVLEHQMIEAVAQADCVVINPEHVAVAMRFDEAEMTAPRVVASGRRLVAGRIKEIARQHGVPIIRNVPLARALAELELDQEIPAELYEAMAEVLRFVYRLDEEER